MRVAAPGLALVFLSCVEASAGPGPTGVLVFSGADGAFDGAHASSGVERAFSGTLDARGLVARITAGSGYAVYPRAPALPVRVVDQTETARLLIGWRETGGYGTVTVFAGLAYENRRVTPRILDDRVGRQIGPAVVVDAWLTPAARVSVQAFAAYATAHGSASLRVAPGYEVASGVHVGPEFGYGAHHGSQRLRFGVHATGLKVMALNLRLSGGYAHTPHGRAGAYASLGLWRRY